MKLSVGDLVVEKKELRPHTSYNIFKIVAFLDGTPLAIHHGFAFDGEIKYESKLLSDVRGSRSWRTSVLRLDEKELCTPEEAIVEIHRLESVKSKIESEFELIRDQIKTNLDQATAVIKKTGELMKPFGKELRDLPNECSDLFLALDDSGWSHSTMQCKHGR